MYNIEQRYRAGLGGGDCYSLNHDCVWMTSRSCLVINIGVPIIHDPVGNLTDDGKKYQYGYNPFGRMMNIIDRVSSDVVNEYAYNGLNQRIKAINDSDADGSLADETPVWFAYDDRWRVIAAYEGAADPTEPSEVDIHHRAGLLGQGGSSYVDALILRDRDTDGGST